MRGAQGEEPRRQKTEARGQKAMGVSVPFLFSFGDCVRLLCMNLRYIFHAIKEERHLALDPDYLEYMKRGKYRFIPGV